MTIVIPKTTDTAIKRGDKGVAAFAVQRLANKLGYPTSEDMDFGPSTEASAKKIQKRIGVTADGVFGPLTQSKICEYLAARQESSSGLPDKLVYSQATYESSGYLAAVGWATPGGVDCGITQRRVYEAQYGDDEAIKRAFDAVYQIDLLGDRVRELHDIFLTRPGVKTSEFAFRLAVLNHNYPTAADQISRVGVNGLSTYWTQPADWVHAIGIKFPDGAPVQTPLEWCQRYALGTPAHTEPGQAVRFVKEWT